MQTAELETDKSSKEAELVTSSSLHIRPIGGIRSSTVVEDASGKKKMHMYALTSCESKNSKYMHAHNINRLTEKKVCQRITTIYSACNYAGPLTYMHTTDEKSIVLSKCHLCSDTLCLFFTTILLYI